ncbi:alpha/beta fold hydrolase [Leptolyngbya sp. FACHB-261]|uniref:alpha/beta fold hydrolase n=1 Tax=Leptolyngbya sp. FACHB-261 TaxID=2692806 RepID=UPI0016864073|nr:alpha/beta hydrolase [Leptolyngbya sp. FACHB-261]MBD2100874.1 alpha/beta hydrolase [Leptolyngbya sp. FACHB-261]
MQPYQFINVGNTQLHYLDLGEGKPVVLLHGDPGSVWDWEAVTPHLAQDYRVLAFDRRGHGLSPRHEPLDARPPAHAEFLRLACRSLQVERPVLVAHSYGCAVALAWAVMHPEDLAGVVLLSPVGEAFQIWASTWIAQASAWGMVLSKPLAPWLSTTVAAPIAWAAIEVAFWPESVNRGYQDRAFKLWTRPTNLMAIAEDLAALTPGLDDLADLAPARSLPIIVAEGAQDLLVGSGPGHWLRRNLPQAQSVCFDHCGHMLQYTRTQAVLDLIRSLLD